MVRYILSWFIAVVAIGAPAAYAKPTPPIAHPNVLCGNCDGSPSCTAANYQQRLYFGGRYWSCWTDGLGHYFWV